MNMKKILIILITVCLVAAAAFLLINRFWPNPVTTTIYTFITVTAPAYLITKIEWVMGSIGAACSIGGVAWKKVNTTKEKAVKAIAVAEDDANQAKNLATSTYGEAQQLKAENTELRAQLKQYETNFSSSKETIMKQEMDIERLRSQIDGLSKQNVDKLADDISMQIAEKNRVA